MKILFVENRYATWIFDAVAARLQAAGHEIHWLVQNPVFRPSSGTVHLLRFPGRSEKTADASFAWLAELDRGVRWFGGDGSHWQCYSRQIDAVLAALQPRVIFGEVTEFHELLTVELAKRRRMPFYQPTSTRYPVGRLQFLSYDTMDPVFGEDLDLAPARLDAMLDDIVERKVKPSYMESSQRSWWDGKRLAWSDRARILGGWIRGERYVTPSPLLKMRLQRRHAVQYRRWENLAHRSLPASLAGKPWVLLPLQMQPESNIELWGHPWSDQVALVRRAAQALHGMGAVLVVKPNPKSKYELSEALCEVVESCANIVAISHTTPMKAVFASAPLVMTVTGTVLLECVLAGKPVASLGSHAMSRYAGVSALAAPESIAAVLRGVLDNVVMGASAVDAKQLLNYLHKTSYPAAMWDPVSRPEMMTRENVAGLVSAFDDVLRKMQ
ncbi:hypothetical protein ACFDR9_001743 [Janthinobacterium sp. CG_23.3]|uniref:hypothetical protein n=1 Tax=unclassified Janthinobacterium TaxID=2610881 RepID=UPI0003466AF6|nr:MULTISPECIES: hypothetical protein [unclassified Janthinobacterium]MEC5162236.1 hypothetical protein [Janthinobacterium sp. CG_S6]